MTVREKYTWKTQRVFVWFFFYYLPQLNKSYLFLNIHTTCKQAVTVLLTALPRAC